MSMRTGSCTGERRSGVGPAGACNDGSDLFNQMVRWHQRFYVLFVLTNAYLQLLSCTRG